MPVARRYPPPGKRRYRAPWAPTTAATGAWQAPVAALSPAVASPTVTVLEQIASNANGYSSPVLGMDWGYHEPRIITQADGTVWTQHFNTQSFAASPYDDVCQVVIRKRTASGVWSTEYTAEVGEDAALLNDPTNERVHLLCVQWNGSGVEYRCVTFPGAIVSVLPGDWKQYYHGGAHAGTQTASRYGSAGIGPDGVVVVKMSVDGGTGAEPTDNAWHYVCWGKWTGTMMEWTGQTGLQIGTRRGYDFVFPELSGTQASVVGIGQYNPHKEDCPWAPGYGVDDYIFAGCAHWRFSNQGAGNYTGTEIIAPETWDGSGELFTRPRHAIVDTVGNRIFTVYYVSNGTVKAQGWWLKVTTLAGVHIADQMFISGVNINSGIVLFQAGDGSIWAVYDRQFKTAGDATSWRVWVIKLNESPANTWQSYTSVNLDDQATSGAYGWNIGSQIGNKMIRCMYASFGRNSGSAMPANYLDLMLCCASSTMPITAFTAPYYPWVSDTSYGRNEMPLWLARIQLY